MAAKVAKSTNPFLPRNIGGMESFGWEVYIYAILIWFTIGSFIATALIWSTIAWNPINKLLFGFLFSILLMFFVVDPAMELLLNDASWVYGAVGVNMLCIGLLAARWRKPPDVPPGENN